MSIKYIKVKGSNDGGNTLADPGSDCDHHDNSGSACYNVMIYNTSNPATFTTFRWSMVRTDYSLGINEIKFCGLSLPYKSPSTIPTPYKPSSPSFNPSCNPSNKPTNVPSITPSFQPSFMPSYSPPGIFTK